ncbi:MAG: D-alanine--poly(phosphoribitol) ligase subunit 1 [Glaciecola sp.]|jgi:D-alanine--poly(phosphoribitol) ligase subunit 1
MSKSNFLSSFLGQVANQPLAIAVEFAKDKATYEELYNQSLKVCKYLRLHADGEVFIGIETKQSIQNYANIIGVWMFGAAYVPLNSACPQKMVDQMVVDLGIKTILSNEVVRESNLEASNDGLNSTVSSEIAYVIHTSGSTGNPKSALVTHGNLNALTSHYLNKDQYEFSANDRFLQSYDLSFDVSVFCFAIPLMLGATVVVPQDKGVRFMTIISSIIKDNITVCSNVPSVAKYAMPRLNEISMSSLRYCFFSGEALHGSWAKAWMKSASGAQVYNCYGPTETTVVCTTELLNELDSAYFESNVPLPLGQPFENMKLVIDDGEICFKGTQVFKGYFGQTEIDHLNYYQTGDLAKFDVNGKLIFQGRKDEQVQINGFRVELAAIDALVFKEFGCQSKTIVVTHLKKSDQLVTVVESESDLMMPGVISYLGTYLPEYSVPTEILIKQKLPLNSNGKLDVKGLINWVQGEI